MAKQIDERLERLAYELGMTLDEVKRLVGDALEDEEAAEVDD